MADQTTIEWAAGILAMIFIAVCGHFQASISGMRKEIENIRQSTSDELDEKLQIVRDDFKSLREELARDRDQRNEVRSRADRTMVTRLELDNQIARVLREFDQRLPPRRIRPFPSTLGEPE